MCPSIGVSNGYEIAVKLLTVVDFITVDANQVMANNLTKTVQQCK